MLQGKTGMEKESGRQRLEKVCNQALSIVKEYVSKEPETIISIEEEEGEWKITVEALERKAVPDTQDLLGRYEIRLKKNGELIGWNQKMLRKRADRMVSSQDEWIITP